MPAISLNINGAQHHVEVSPDQNLLTVLRDQLDLTGTKYGCGEGQCGACTVLLDGQPTRSCITLATSVADKKITTIEGLEREGHLHPVQQAFLDKEAFQCGYCTSGMVVVAIGLLNKSPHPSDEQIIESMNGNICRCGTYLRILAAVRQAAGATKS